MILTEYKPIGMTCGELIKKYENIDSAYVGVLDPMAHGIITILTGPDLSKMQEHMKKNKVYKFKFIVGPNTDTDDILGIFVLDDKSKYINLEKVINYINNFPFEYKQKYHTFSSYKPKKKTKEGKRRPLWWWTVNGYHIDDVPARNVKLYSKKIERIYRVSGDMIQGEFLNKISKIKGDKFRKGETIKQWTEYDFDEYYDVFECTITVSSGFYVRQFVKDMSDHLGVKMIVIDIERTLIF
jgi:tRNA U55 pseudouridine synthase TruB